MTIDEQLEILLRGTQFADELDGDEAGAFGGGTATTHTTSGNGAPSTAPPADVESGRSLRQQMTLELKERLQTGKALRVYLGADPTATSLHIGHFVPVQKLRVWQDLGHQIIFLIGDYTGLIGDPTGQSAERKRLTHDQLMAMSTDYQSQVFRILDPEKTEVRFNGEWLSKLTFADVIEISAIIPLKWIVSRRDFAARLAKGESLRLHETLYCLMQGYDAYALDCDVQIGGYDQHFNLIAGRWVQEHFGKKPQVLWTYPLLMGTDGRKMSKSFGNAINILDTPEDMYGKCMRIADDLLPSYIDLTTNFSPAEANALKARLREPGTNPMDVKKEVATNLVTQYHGSEAAAQGADHFRQVVQEKAAPDDIPEVRVHAGIVAPGSSWPDVLVSLRLAASKGEVRRLMEHGGFYVEQEPVTDPRAPADIRNGLLIRLGKRRYFKLVV